MPGSIFSNKVNEPTEIFRGGKRRRRMATGSGGVTFVADDQLDGSLEARQQATRDRVRARGAANRARTKSRASQRQYGPGLGAQVKSMIDQQHLRNFAGAISGSGGGRSGTRFRMGSRKNRSKIRHSGTHRGTTGEIISRKNPQTGRMEHFRQSSNLMPRKRNTALSEVKANLRRKRQRNPI